MEQDNGFTLLELLVSIAVLSVVLSLAVPNFQSLLRDTRHVTFYNKMSSTLRYARSEAIKRSTSVSVCARTTDTSCGTDWSGGMLVFLDSASVGTALQYDTGDSTLRTTSVPESGITMSAKALFGNNTTTTSTAVIRFNDRGQPNWINGTLVLCDGRGANHAKAMVMTGSGIGRKAYSTTTSNDVVVDATGTAVTCP